MKSNNIKSIYKDNYVNYNHYTVFVIIILFSMNCSNLLYESRFIDIENTLSIQPNMTIEETISLIGDPNYTEIKNDEMENQIIVHHYKIRDKVYKNIKLPQSENILIRDSQSNKYVGFGKQRELKLYFRNGLLLESKIE